MPYARPPLGKLRFQKTQPVSYSIKRRINSTVYQRVCPQPSNRHPKSENCLFLNVRTPTLDQSAKLPVMLYIHGGNFVANSSIPFDSPELALRDVVLVTINYRLGVLGFLCTNRSDAPGNQGLWDQAMAMYWTQQYIKYFGGNANEVTIFGQSVGSVSVSSHIVSNITNHYFKRAIMESGSSYGNSYIKSKEYSARLNRRYIEYIGCNKNGMDYIECLRRKSTQELVQATKDAVIWNIDVPDASPRYISVAAPFVLCFGDEFLPKTIIELLEEKNFRKNLKVLLGHQTNDIVTQTFRLIKPNIRRYNPKLKSKFIHITVPLVRSDIIDIIHNQSIDGYVAGNYTKTFGQGHSNKTRLRITGAGAFADYFYICPTVLFGKYLAQFSNFRVNVHQYYLTYANSHSACYKSDWCTAYHGDDYPLVFGYPFIYQGFGYDEQDKYLSRIMMNIWTSFAKTGNVPHVNGNAWSPYSRLASNKNEVSINYLELNADNRRLGRVFTDKYKGNNGFKPSVMQNCKQFWDPIFRSFF